jgi:diguanylate cyclase (GGDEF)-like protein
MASGYPAPAAPPLISWSARIKRFWEPPDGHLLDAGQTGELVVAKLRLVVTLALLLIPIANLIFAPRDEWERHLLGLFLTLLAVGVAALTFALVLRDRRRRWLPMATSLLDVTLVSSALFAFGVKGAPLEAVNGLVTFDIYFLAIAGTCLRYDRRVALVAGLAAVSQYFLVVGVMAVRFDVGHASVFAWPDQIARGLNLSLATALALAVVAAMQKQRELSTSDALTGIFNRRFFDDYFGNEIERAARYRTPVSVAMIDIDHFKRFNDVYGHAVGDRALKTVARVLQRAVRRSDLVARYGGEEFVLLLRETEAGQAADRLEGIRRAVEAEPLLTRASSPARITVSAGLASWPEDGLTPADLLNRADQRLFDAKHRGRNRIVGPLAGPVKDPAATPPGAA